MYRLEEPVIVPYGNNILPLYPIPDEDIIIRTIGTFNLREGCTDLTGGESNN